MTERSKKIIRDEILSLPKEAQEAINNSNWEKISEQIGKKHLLDEDELSTFQLETASFLLGLVDEYSYPENIEEEVGISKDEAKKITDEVLREIVGPINNILAEKIKESEKVKNSGFQQNLDFILSGGDYGVFLSEEEEGERESNSGSGILRTKPSGSGKMEDIKSKLVI